MNPKIEQQLKRQLQAPKERKDRVKQGAIKLGSGFLVIMISLTVLSRAADSIIIPQVVAGDITSGRLDHSIEVSGQLHAEHDSGMEVGSGLIVSKIYVEEGDQVKTGDVLLELDAKEVEQRLVDLRRELEKLFLQKQQMLLEGNVGAIDDPVVLAEEQLERLEEDKERTISSEVLKLERLQQEYGDKLRDLETAKQELEMVKQEFDKTQNDTMEKSIEEATEGVNNAKAHLEDEMYERDKAIERSQMAVDNAQENLWLLGGGEATSAIQSLERAEMDLKQTRSDWERRIQKAEEDLAIAEEKLENLESGEVDDSIVKQAEEGVQLIEKEIVLKERAIADAKVDQEITLDTLDRQIEDAKKEIEKAKEEKSNDALVEEQEEKKDAIRMQLMELDIEAKQQEISKLEAIVAQSGQFKAYADGIITEVKVEEGTKTTEGTVLTFVGEDSQYRFEVEITEEQSEQVQVGDDVILTLEGQDKQMLSAKIDQIVPNLSDSSGKVKVIVNVEEGYPGQKVTMKTKGASEQHHSVLPVEALRKDNEEEYILVVREKETTLGKQMVVEKIPVVVTDRNQKQVAIQGSVGSQDQVIVSSNKPIQAGDRVRLIEE